ncbi:MAG: FxsA family protein [Boseongicola sp.]|nr:MAG: FxsA family protein [Boseongicola sp.]
MRLFLLFLIVPLIEIALFIQVGGAIGLLATLAIVIITAVLGAALVRSQGLAVMGRVRSSFEELSDPTEPLAHGAMILFSGALLLTPGFFTDAIGFSLMVPAVRSWLFRSVKSKIKVQPVEFGSQSNESFDPTVVDVEYEDLDPPNSSGPSGWTRH